ncbi:MAG: BamA/TamA family outer membrane protein, partial [Gemmatimonadales bacterium]
MRGTPLLLLGLLPCSTLAAQKPDSTQAADTTAVPPPDTARPAEPARVPEEPEPRETRRSESPWRTSYFPYLTGGANDGPVLTFRVRYFQPAAYEDRTTYTGAFTADAGISPRGSRQVTVQFKAPLLWDGWRLVALASAERLARFGYFGVGNETTFDNDLVDEAQPFLYRVRRTRYRGQAEVTRRLRGPLHLAFMAEVEQARFTSLPGPSTFVTDVPSGELEQDDVSGRLALVYDTRDNEFDTHQGLLLEAGTQVGSGGDGYTRTYAMLRGYLTVREGTVLAARLTGSGMGGTPTLNARYTLPGWEHSLRALGGEQSHRSLDTGRMAGKGTLFVNLEAHHDLLNLGDLGAVTLLAFLDAGRVFEEESFRLTTEDMKVGGG